MKLTDLTTAEFIAKIEELRKPGHRKFARILEHSDRLILDDGRHAYLSPNLVEMTNEEFESITVAMNWHPVMSVDLLGGE